MPDISTTIVAILCAVVASNGFWMLMQKVFDKKDQRLKLVVGVAHDIIIERGTLYLKRGFITHDEYENLYEYLYLPYSGLGGNGTARKVMDEVAKLPFKAQHKV